MQPMFRIKRDKMKIITKYYDKNGKLRILKNDSDEKTVVRFKILNDGREFPSCDFRGKCTNKAYAEVYPFLLKKSKSRGWSYLCRKHYMQEQKKFNGKLPACFSVEW